MLLMLGGSGAGKGTFLRATWLNFRYHFFWVDIFVWVKSICLVLNLHHVYIYFVMEPWDVMINVMT